MNRDFWPVAIFVVLGFIILSWIATFSVVLALVLAVITSIYSNQIMIFGTSWFYWLKSKLRFR